MFSKLSFQRKCSQYEFYFKTIIVKTYLLIHQCFDSLLIHSHSFSRTCPNRGMFYGRIRPFYFCSIYYSSISVHGQYIGYIYLEKILIFEKILLCFLVFGFIKKFEELFLIAKTCFCVHSVGGGWVDKNIYTEMCRKKKIILPGYDFCKFTNRKTYL